MNAATVTGLDTTVLETQVRGPLIRPDDDGYDRARAIYNGMIDRRPALIVRCADVADVIAGVNYARTNGLELAVRGGGHGVPGYAVSDGGTVLDLSAMKGIVVDPQQRLVTVEGGCTLGDVDHATHAFGLAVPGGVISTTGVGGLTLGGGHGYLTRAHGLTIDNLVSANVVTADGSFVAASENENEDLFWALRGGGGNFGVVTSFTFRLHPVEIVVAGPILWHMEQAADAMRMYEQVLAGATDHLYGAFVFLVVPPGPPFPEELQLENMCGVAWCHTGTPEQASDDLARVREFGPPAFDLVGAMPYPVLQSMFDAIAPPGMQNYWRGNFINELSDESIAAHVEHGAHVPNIFSGLHLYPVDGAAARVPSDGTAWSYREARWSEVIFAADPDPASADAMKAWVVETWDALHRFSAGGSYVNFMGEEGQERVRTSYRGNYDRLAQAKKRYDPANLFHLNQNIVPAG